MDRTHNGKAFRILAIMDEYSRECLSIEASNPLPARIESLPGIDLSTKQPHPNFHSNRERLMKRLDVTIMLQKTDIYS